MDDIMRTIRAVCFAIVAVAALIVYFYGPERIFGAESYAAKYEADHKENKAKREEQARDAAEEHAAGYDESTDEDYSDFGEPSVKLN